MMEIWQEVKDCFGIAALFTMALAIIILMGTYSIFFAAFRWAFKPIE